jgi:hypothetical protein
VPSRGTFRIVVTYPSQPENGEIRIATEGRFVVNRGWTQSLRYRLEPGHYTLIARAEYSRSTYIDYTFNFNVTRSGS